MKRALFATALYLLLPVTTLFAVNWGDIELPSKNPVVALRGNDKFLYWMQAAASNAPYDRTVGRMTPQGSFQFFTISQGVAQGPSAIGPDGSLYYVQNNQYIMQIRAAGGDPVVAFNIPLDLRSKISFAPKAMAATSDGGVWVGAGEPGNPFLVRFAAGEELTLFQTHPLGTDAAYMPIEIHAVSHREVWYLTHQHAIRSGFSPRLVYSPSSSFRPSFIYGARDGKMFFGNVGGGIGGEPRIIEWPGGRVLFTAFSILWDGVFDRDGLLWFSSDGEIRSLLPDGTVTRHFSGPPTYDGIVNGPHNRLYFAQLQRPGWLTFISTCDGVGIVTQPRDVTVAPGGTAVLEVTAGGRPPYSYQWFQGEANDQSRPVGTNSPRLTLTNVTSTGRYWVRITNECAVIPSNVVTVSVSAPTCPQMSSQIIHMNWDCGGDCQIGKPVTFSAGSFGYSFDCAPHSFSWNFGDGGTASGKNVTHAYTSGGQYRVVLTIANSQQTLALDATVVIPGAVPSACPAMTSSNTFISYSDPVSGCTDISGECRSGSPVTFTASSFAYSFDCAPHTFSWAAGNTAIGSGRTIIHTFPTAGRHRVTLAITNSQQTFTRVVDVPVSGVSNGSRRRGVVRPPGGGGSCVSPSIATQPASQVVASGAAVPLSVTATGTGPLSYQWFAGNSGDTASPVAGASGAAFTTPSITSPRSYWVRINNSCGTVSSATAFITLSTSTCVSPTITTHPANVSIASGTSATLNVAASGTAPLSYQWYRGSSGDITSPVSGATSSAFSTGPIAQTSAFWVQVRNSCGSAASSTATISISAVPADGQPFRVDSGVPVEARRRPRVSADRFGTVAVQWEELSDINTSQLHARIRNQNGSWHSEFRVSTFALRGIFDQVGTELAASRSLNGGVFMSAWYARTTASGNHSSQAQRFVVPGQVAGINVCFDFSGCGRENQSNPDVAADANGMFYFAWLRDPAGSPSGYLPHVVSYDPLPSVLGLSLSLADDTTPLYSNPRIAVDANGNGWAVWETTRTGGTSVLEARRVLRGVPTGSTHQLSPLLGFTNYDVSCQLVQDRCLAVWNTSGPDGSGSEIWGRILEPGGPAGSATIQVNPDTASFYGSSAFHEYPRVTDLARGGWVVSWRRDGLQVVFQELASNGTRIGQPAPATEGRNDYHGGWDVTGLPDGSYALVWSEQSSSRREIWMRVLASRAGQ